MYNCLVAWTSVSRVLGRNRRVDVEVEGMKRGVLKCTVVSWPNLDWQKTADFPTTSAHCLFRADACGEIKRAGE